MHRSSLLKMTKGCGFCASGYMNTVRQLKKMMTISYYSKYSTNLAWIIFARFIFLLGVVYIEVASSYPINKFVSALTENDEKSFYKYLGQYVFFALIAGPVFATDDYVYRILSIKITESCSKEMLGGYFSNQTFFHICSDLDIDNPGQRISRNIPTMVNSLIGILEAFLHQILRLAGYSYVLFSIAPNAVPGIILYSITISILGLRVFGAKLSTINEQLTKYMSDYTASLVRVRVHSESIAFYRGGMQENNWVSQWFSLVITQMRLSAFWNAWFQFFLYFTQYLTTAIPYLLLAPELFAQKIKYGDLTQSVIAFRALLNAMNIAVRKLSTIASLNAATRRVHEVRTVIETQQRKQLRLTNYPIKGASSENKETETFLSSNSDSSVKETELDDFRQVSYDEGVSLTLKNVSVIIPNDRTILIADLNFELTLSQESLLIVGKSGVGKSSLLKVIAGLWPEGSAGSITKPRDVMFFPQKPYMPYIPLEANTLRSQVLFPWYDGKEEISDQMIIRALNQVNLGHILERCFSTGDGIRRSEDWGSICSHGEQQRIAFARLLLANPQLAFLDEATSALDEMNELKMYDLLKKSGISYVSVGHHPQLARYHTRVLMLEGQGAYRFLRPEEYISEVRERLASSYPTL